MPHNQATEVLLVEDDLADAGLVRRALRGAGRGLVLHHQTTLGGALEWMAVNSCDVVLLDLSLPDSHGFGTIRRMREAFPAVPLVVLTGHDDSDFAVASMEAGTQDYLVKGAVDGASLFRAIRYAIARMHLEEKLRRSEQRLNNILTLARDAILVTDENRNIVMFNPAAERMFGYCAGEVLGGPLGRLFPEPHPEMHGAEVDDVARLLAADENGSGQLEAVALAKGGREFLVEISLSSSADHGEVLTTAVIRDLTERKRLEQELRCLAATDPLTGLPNRRSFLEAAENELDRVRRFERPLAVLMLDIDHFKRINDQWGHASGDEALKRLGAISRKILRSSDVVGRLGGEEFGVLLPETEMTAAADAAERLRAAVAAMEIVAVDGTVFRMTVSIGITTCLATDPSIDACLARADNALYRAKERGRNLVEIESPLVIAQVAF